MSIYFFNSFYVFDDLENNFLKLNKLVKNDNIENSDYIFFHNFNLTNKKFLQKNKDLLKLNIICYIHEPICLNDSETKKIVRRVGLFPYIKILTYSLDNIPFIKRYINNSIQYFPINYYFYPDIRYNKTLDISIYHRNYKNKYNNNNYNFEIISSDVIEKNNLILFNHFSEEKTKFFSNLKIFINLHKSNKTKLLETLRIHELIKYRVIVISQKCFNYLDPLSKYVIFTEDNNLVDKANEVLKNYDFYFKKIYGDKTNKNIFNSLPKNIY